MRLISLYRKAQVVGHALVDDEDYPTLGTWCWGLDSGNGYVRGPLGIYMHRFLMALEPGDGLEVDHINRNRLDNRRSNLRVVTRGQNKQNLGAYRGSTSPARGVCWSEAKQAWEASVRRGGKRVFFKRFKSEGEAARAAADARKELLDFSVS